MKRRSAGILLFRRDGPSLEVLLAHPGGPFWKKTDEGAWSIPKGEYDENEDPLAAAKREFAEEIGVEIVGELFALGEVRQSSGKIVTVWAIEHDFDPATLKSNTFELEWPPKSGKRHKFAEVDRAEWFSFPVAHQKILPGQREFLSRLERGVR